MAARKLNSKNVRSSLTTRAASTKTIKPHRENIKGKYYWTVRDFKGRFISKGRAVGELRTKDKAYKKFKEDKTFRIGYSYYYQKDWKVIEVTKKDAGKFKRDKKRPKKDYNEDVENQPDKRLKDVKGKTSRNYSAKIIIDGNIYQSRGRTKKSAAYNLSKHISKSVLRNADSDASAGGYHIDSLKSDVTYSEIYYRKRKK